MNCSCPTVPRPREWDSGTAVRGREPASIAGTRDTSKTFPSHQIKVCDGWWNVPIRLIDGNEQVAPFRDIHRASQKLPFAKRRSFTATARNFRCCCPEADFEMRANCAPSNLMEQQRQRGAGFLIYAPMMHQAPSFGAWWTRPRCFSRWQASLTVPGVHRSAAAAMQSSALRCRRRQRRRGSVAAVRPGP